MRLVIISGALLLANGCSDPKAASDENFQSALALVASDFTNHCAYYGGSRDEADFSTTGWEPVPVFDALVAEGLATRVTKNGNCKYNFPDPSTLGLENGPTPNGSINFRGGRVFSKYICPGELVIEGISSYTIPASGEHHQVSDVTYRWSTKNVHPTIAQLIEDGKFNPQGRTPWGAVAYFDDGGPQLTGEASITLTLTSDGWKFLGD